MEEPTAEILYKLLHSFVSIYDADGKELNALPKEVKLTVYCKGTHEEGFLYNVKSDELGLEALIAEKWILQTDLDNILTK